MPWIIVVAGYLIGSIPTAYIAGHIAAGGDIRRVGDENVGAANAFRQMSRKAGIIVGLIDAGKGALVVFIAQAVNTSQLVVLLTGLATVIGHNWPVFLSFRGGRGVSTTIGILFMLVTVPMAILTLPTILILILRKNVTPAMAFLFVLLPLVDWWLGVPVPLILYGLALAILVGITTFLRNRPRAIRQV